MITESQSRLAHRIATTGLVSYNKAVEFIEKQSSVVDFLKRSSDTMHHPLSSDNSYIFARFAAERNLANFWQAYLAHEFPTFAKKHQALTQQIADNGAIDESFCQHALATRSEWLTARVEKALKDDPFAHEWHAEQEEKKLALIWLAERQQGSSETFESFKQRNGAC